MYDTYIDLCTQHGIDRECIQKFMDYQTITDFIISNTDEHLLNFGVLRDSDTLKLIGPAPIYDSGNSMFFSDERTTPYSRAGLLERKMTSFYDTEDKMLAKVKLRDVVKLDLLPSPKELRNKTWHDSRIPTRENPNGFQFAVYSRARNSRFLFYIK